MEGRLQEKVKHVEYLYDELETKDKEINKLKICLEDSDKLYRKKTAEVNDAKVDNCRLSKELDNSKEDIAILKNKRCEKGCDRYNKSVHEIVDAAAKHREKLLALKELSEAQKEKIFCLRGHRNELFDTIDKLNSEHVSEIDEKNEKLASLQEENKILIGQLRDQKEEIESLIYKTKSFETSLQEKSSDVLRLSEKSLADELKLVEIEEFESDIKESKTVKQGRKSFFDKLDELSMKRNKELSKLMESIDKLNDKKVAVRCKYGWDCFRRFCKYDHSYLYVKVNKITCNKELIEKELSSEMEVHNENNVTGTKKKNYQCSECCKSFKKNTHLKKHKRKNHGEKYSCIICKKVFDSQRKLKVHLGSEHDQQQPESEVICSTETKDNINENKENTAAQKNDETRTKSEVSLLHSLFKCEICRICFKNGNDLEDHFDKNHLDEFRCGFCKVEFERIIDMDDHMDLKHKGMWKLNDPDILREGDSEYENEFEED